MSNRSFTFFLTFLCLMSGYTKAPCQTFLKVPGNPDQNLNQKISRFENGDLLIGDSSVEPLQSGSETGIVQLSRLDQCGSPLWSFQYEVTEGYLELNDFLINDLEEVFLYGSFYQGFFEHIFLMKVDGKTGRNSDFLLWNTGTVDHFTFDIELKAGQLLIYGLRLDIQSPKEGLLAAFDQNLTFQWAKAYRPFTSAAGEALISNDGNILCWSGNNLFKTDQQGTVLASFVLDGGNTQIIAGPVEVEDGFVFQAHSATKSFFFKLDDLGQIIWQTALFAAADAGSAITPLGNGNLLCTYSCPNGDFRQLCQLQILPDGQISQQRRLSVEPTMNPGTIYQSIRENQLTIASNHDPFQITPSDIEDFILQFSLDDLNEACLPWQSFDETQPNNIPLQLRKTEMNAIDFILEFERSIGSNPSPLDLELNEQCGTFVDIEQLERDTLLPCNTDFWEVTLPTSDFYWTDGSPERPRKLETPGFYSARNRSCIDPVTLTFRLEKESCGCSVSLPNAFSPNNDGVNDELEVFSSCPLSSLEISVFSRWGERIFYRRSVDAFWDGNFHGDRAVNGVYLVVVKYQWADVDGKIQEGMHHQSVVLLN